MFSGVEIEVADLDEALQACQDLAGLPRRRDSPHRVRGRVSDARPCRVGRRRARTRRPTGRVSGAADRRLRHRRGSGAGRRAGRAGALADQKGSPSGPTRGCSPSRGAEVWTGCGAITTTSPSWRNSHWPVHSEPDDRLRLIFTCCHPALPRAGADRAHPAGRVRPDDSPDRPGVPDAGNDDGATDHPCQTKDHRCRDSVPDPRPRTSWVPA